MEASDAAAERPGAERRQAVRKRDGDERRAVFESAILKPLDAIGHCHVAIGIGRVQAASEHARGAEQEEEQAPGHGLCSARLALAAVICRRLNSRNPGVRWFTHHVILIQVLSRNPPQLGPHLITQHSTRKNARLSKTYTAAVLRPACTLPAASPSSRSAATTPPPSAAGHTSASASRRSTRNADARVLRTEAGSARLLNPRR